VSYLLQPVNCLFVKCLQTNSPTFIVQKHEKEVTYNYLFKNLDPRPRLGNILLLQTQVKTLHRSFYRLCFMFSMCDLNKHHYTDTLLFQKVWGYFGFCVYTFWYSYVRDSGTGVVSGQHNNLIAILQ